MSSKVQNMMISDVVEAVIFEIETWLKLREPRLHQKSRDRDFKICAFCWFL